MNFQSAFQLAESAFRGNRLPHAYLVQGNPRTNAWEFAIRVSQLLLCTEKQTPCGTCDSCRRVEHLGHPDLFLLEPEKKSRIISMESMREVFLPWVAKQAFSGGWKIGIIVFADRMNDSSANAFLKTLEEPPPRTLFLLLSDKPDALLTTIRSRCQILDLNEGRVPPDEPWRSRVGEILASHSRATQLRAFATAMRFQGLFDEINAIATQQTEEKYKTKSDDPTAPVMDNERLKALISAREKELRRTIYDAIQEWYRDLMVLSSLQPDDEVPELCFPEHAETLRRRAARIPLRIALRFIDFSQRFQEQIEVRNIRPNLVFQYWFSWMS